MRCPNATLGTGVELTNETADVLNTRDVHVAIGAVIEPDWRRLSPGLIHYPGFVVLVSAATSVARRAQQAADAVGAAHFAICHGHIAILAVVGKRVVICRGARK